MAYHYTLGVSAVVSLITYYAYTKILRCRRVSAFCSQHGCLKPPPSEDSGIFGLRLILNFRAKVKAKKLLEEQVSRYRELGNTFTASLLGNTLILTIEPENIRTILANKFDDFGLGRRLDGFSPLLTGGIFVNDGEPWKHSRALVRPAFTRNQVADLGSFETHVQALTAKIPKDGSMVDMGPLSFCLTLDQASEFLLGESVNSQNGGEDSPQARFGAAFDYALDNLGGWRTSGVLSYLWPDRRFLRDCITVRAFVKSFVEKARSHAALPSEDERDLQHNKDLPSSRYVFLDELAKVTDDPRQMIDELLSILLAGRDTTASMLTSAFNILGKRPDVWAKLRAEAAPLAGEPPDYETLRNMKYLKYFLNESTSPNPPIQLIVNGKYVLQLTKANKSAPPLPRRPRKRPRSPHRHCPPPRRRR